jgi:hypothetical protein
MNKKEKRENKLMSRKEKNPGHGYRAKEATERPLRAVEDPKRKG